MREKKKKRTGKSQIHESLLVEQKTGGFVVLSTPLIELLIQKTLKNAKKLEQKMFHVKHFCSKLRTSVRISAS